MPVHLRGLREVPIPDLSHRRERIREHRGVQAAALEQDRPGVIVLELVRVLPYEAHQVRDAVHGVARRREGAHLRQRRHPGPCLRFGPAPAPGLVGFVAPREAAAVGALCRQLPLVDVRQPLPRPRAVGPRLRQRDPDDGLSLLTCRWHGPRRGRTPPREEVVGVSRFVPRGVQIPRKLRLGDEVLVHVQGADPQQLVVETARCGLPRELHINASVVLSVEGARRRTLGVARALQGFLTLGAAHAADAKTVASHVATSFDLSAGGAEAVRRPGHEHHAGRRFRESNGS
mmetsp:Transcript_160436/g.514941  ORF Transcript_160436/g.514941 Transcript_160436/m.514941 type:complete len:288 (-) Transcript_160436:1495-2358(-)